jgi:hypothetical protein
MRKNKFRASPSYRFAQFLDVLLLTACLTLSVIGIYIPTYTLAGFLAAVSVIYAVFDFNLGRNIFSVLLTRGWLPKSVKQASKYSFFFKDEAALAPVATQHFKSLTF